MAQYLALTYTADVDWFAPEHAAELAEYREFGQVDAGSILSSAVLHPTSTATVADAPGSRLGSKQVSGPAPVQPGARTSE